jgi:sugar (pentulose or hexulose) kinase
MALATMAPKQAATMAHQAVTLKGMTALHYGFIPGTYVLLPVAESGGVCLEWFKNSFMKEYSYDEINILIAQKQLPNELLFLPYIIGTNAPEFDAGACGVFYGIRAKHDAVDFAYAVMEGVAHLLAKNINDLSAAGVQTERIIATGGGAKSGIWCQIQADVTGVPVEIPAEKETACLGAAIIGAVDDGIYSSFAYAAEQIVRVSKRFEPAVSVKLQRKHKQFEALYKAMIEITGM